MPKEDKDFYVRTLETAIVEYVHSVLGDRLHIVTTGGQISNCEPDLDCLTLLKTSDVKHYNIHHKYNVHT